MPFMLQPFSHLPAYELVSPLQEAVTDNNIIVGAPPGAGKSTVLPLSLLQSSFKGKILLMQPRRVVVRNLAEYLARQLNESVGETVGYRIKGESKVSSTTRLEIITEGVLTRMIQQDPELAGIAAIVFDEFHERSIHSDFGLALALEVQSGLRDDLRLIVMSATLDVAPLEALLNAFSVLPVMNLHTQGRMFPVDIRYTQDVQAYELVPKTCNILKQAVSEHEGDILVFLPGRGSINAVAREIKTLAENTDIAVHMLYGALSKLAQQAAIAPDPHNKRKIILSTNIAETSLTIEGVTVVIDSLWENSAQYHPSSDITALTQQRISQASAIQRAGRAGRVMAGTCYRLCSKSSFERLAKHNAAQIEKEDLSSFLLDTLAWGSSPGTLALLTKPTQAQQQVAQQKLHRVNAISHSSITPYGRALAQLPCQPHLAHLLLTVRAGIDGLSADENSALRYAAPFVVAMSESNINVSGATNVMDALLHVNSSTRSQLLKQASRYARYVQSDNGKAQNVKPDINALDERALGLCIAIAFPLLVGYRRSASGKSGESPSASKNVAGGATRNGSSQTNTIEYKLASGKGAELTAAGSTSIFNESDKGDGPWLAVLDGQLIKSTVAIRLAQPVPETWLRLAFPDAFSEKRSVILNSDTGVMEARASTGFYDITLNSKPVSGQEKSREKAFWDEALCDAWFAYLDALPLSSWPLSDADWQWWRRVEMAGKLNLPQDKAFGEPDPWPLSLSGLVQKAKDSLAPVLKNCKSTKALKQLPWKTALNNGLSWPQQDALATLLPIHVTIPTGREASLDFRENGDVVLPVKMTELYSQNAPITLAGGRVTVVCELLSPAGRPLQTTSDLAAFWQGSYREIQKEMKGRYPKHFWPDDPANAVPTSKTKKHM
ncbi:DEAD/DEAH box helicase [Alteromonas sp. ALT199]|uniref:ATP-dependent RNA helicase n=1 Tax=unclassified Alteromonas TaxID=2614992 RepID=UPI001BEAB3C7|nr:ATP-dependent helicase C-terminal domain-containing protein [Alteromonas sp. ALT199]MBT3135759.1 DEAD/DEAH box helicase [Alteromonas sp. ALT199]